MDKKKKILIAPLDWGLGHLTRCLALADILYQEEHDIYWALSNETTIKIVKSYFPKAKYLMINSYDIQYAKEGKWFFWKLFLQTPHIFKNIRKEHQLLKQWQKEYAFNLVIADNRYGLYHAAVQSVFITHQLYLQSGKSTFLDRIAQYFHRLWLKRFTNIWKMDDVDLKVSGDLSWKKEDEHLAIGLSSQFMLLEEQEEIEEDKERKEVLFLLSGPEPQRTLLEEAIRNEAPSLKDYDLVLVRGSLSESSEKNEEHFKTCIDLGNAMQLKQIIQDADLVISRSGYSTLMDLLYLQKKMLLIPTPGQTEQMYLADYFENKGWAMISTQENLLLKEKIAEALALEHPIFSVSLSRERIVNALSDSD